MAPRKQPGTDVTDWTKEMEAQAKIAADAQRTGGGGGSFFSLKAGQLSFGGNTFPGNQMAAVILGHVIENSYYDTAYDPDTPAGPKCFAFAESEEDLAPNPEHLKDDYFDQQSEACDGCPMNEWGSARTGRGKACSNVMRLALIPAGEYKMKGGRNAGMELVLYDDPEHFAKAEVAYMKLPVMSVKNYSAFVKQLAADIRRPPWGIIVNISLAPDAKSQFKVVFELVDELSNDLLAVTMPRHSKVMDGIAFPYTPPMEREEPKATPANNKLRRGAAATGKAAAKR